MTSEDVGSPPRILLIASVSVLVIGSLIVLLGAYRIGVSFDEPYHVLRLHNYFHHGWYVLDDDLRGDAPGPWAADIYVYAPVTALLAHGANTLFGIESWGHPSATGAAYAGRHLVVAVMGLIGIGGTVLLGRLVHRNWGWAVVSGAVLVAIPMWPGHSMFNIKDVPVGAGYTSATLGLALLAGRSRSSATRLSAILAGSSGLLLAVGTRPAMWTGIGAGTVLFLALMGLQRSRRAEFWGRCLDAVAMWSVAMVVLLVVYPSGFGDPIRWMVRSVTVSAAYGQSGVWWYIPLNVLIFVPTLLLLLGCLGWAQTARRSFRARALTPSVIATLLVAAQAFVMPALAMVKQSFLYDDLRQVLFAAPAVAILLSLGLRSLVGRAGSVQWSWALLASLALAVPVVVELQLFPYAYAYASELSDAAGVPTSNDYWRTSTRELAPRLPDGEFVVCSPAQDHAGHSMRYLHVAGRAPADRSTDCRTDPISPIAPYRDFSLTDKDPVGTTFLGIVSRRPGPGQNCRVLDRVTRRRYLTTQTMATLVRCQLVLLDYPALGLRLDPDGTGSEYLLGGWTSNPGMPGITLREPTASLGFTLPVNFRDRALILRVRANGTPDEMLVNNKAVDWRRRGDNVEIKVPAHLVGSMGEGRLVMTVRARPDSFRVTAVAVEASE